VERAKSDVQSLLSSLTASKHSVKKYLNRSFAKKTVCVHSPWVVVFGGMDLFAHDRNNV
jgi:hypothetical protein